MTLAVSYTDFRDNLSDHLEYLKRGNKVLVRDAKKGKDLITLVAETEEEFDWDSHLKFIKTLAGSGLLAGKEDELARRKFRNSINKKFAEARKH